MGHQCSYKIESALILAINLTRFTAIANILLVATIVQQLQAFKSTYILPSLQISYLYLVTLNSLERWAIIEIALVAFRACCGRQACRVSPCKKLPRREMARGI